MKRFELHIIPTGGCKLSQDAGESTWEEQSSSDGLFIKLKTYAAPLFGTGDVNCGWESYTREGVCRKRRGMHTWTTPCTSTSTTTNTATTFEAAHHNAYGQFISAVRDNEWYMVPYGTYSYSTSSPYYELHTASKLLGTATATIIGTDTTTATVTSTAGAYPCFTQYGAYTLMSSINNIPWKWRMGDATPTALITSGSMYKFKYLATFYDTIFGAFDGTTAGAISIRYTNTLPDMAALTFPAANQLYKPDDDYGITALVTFGRKALLVFGRKSLMAIDYYSGYSPPFEIQQLVNGVGTADHKSVVVTGDAVYFYDRDRATFHEYIGGATSTNIGLDVQKIVEDWANYLVDVVGSYDPKYDVVSWTLKSSYLGYYDFGAVDVVAKTSTLASNPFSNITLEYHRPSKRWYIDSQRRYNATTGYDDFTFCKLPISQVHQNQRSRMIVVPNYGSQFYYEVEEYYDEQTITYPMTRIEPVLWQPMEDRHKRIQEVRLIFGATTEPIQKDNATGTPSLFTFNTGVTPPFSGTTATDDPFEDRDWVDPSNIGITSGAAVCSLVGNTGVKYPRTAASVSSAPFDDVTWTNVNNVKTADSSDATVVMAANQRSYLIKASNFDFADIPDGATINGVVCTIKASANYPYGYLDLCQLLDADGALTGADQISSPVVITNYPYYGTYTYGSSTSVWGATLTPAVVKDADFGVAIGGLVTVSASAGIRVEHVALTVYYTPGSSYLLKASQFDFSSIPSGATIVGIACTINALATGTCTLELCQLLDADGALTGDDMVSSSISMSTAGYTDYVLGGSTNLWGATVALATAQDSDFGVAVGFTATGTGDNTVSVESITLNLYYAFTVSGEYLTAADTTMGMLCYYGDNKNLVAATAAYADLGQATVDSNGECVFYCDIPAKYYQLVWGQTPAIANGIDCPVAKIIVKGCLY